MYTVFVEGRSTISKKQLRFFCGIIAGNLSSGSIIFVDCKLLRSWSRYPSVVTSGDPKRFSNFISSIPDHVIKLPRFLAVWNVDIYGEKYNYVGIVIIVLCFDPFVLYDSL